MSISHPYLNLSKHLILMLIFFITPIPKLNILRNPIQLFHCIHITNFEDNSSLVDHFYTPKIIHSKLSIFHIKETIATTNMSLLVFLFQQFLLFPCNLVQMFLGVVCMLFLTSHSLSYLYLTPRM